MRALEAQQLRATLTGDLQVYLVGVLFDCGAALSLALEARQVLEVPHLLALVGLHPRRDLVLGHLARVGQAAGRREQPHQVVQRGLLCAVPEPLPQAVGLRPREDVEELAEREAVRAELGPNIRRQLGAREQTLELEGGVVRSGCARVRQGQEKLRRRKRNRRARSG